MNMIWKRQQLSDEEFVAVIRKRDSTLRRTRWLYPILFIAFIWCIVMVVQLVHRFGEFIPRDRGYLWAGFGLGVLLGLMFAVIAFNAGMTLKNWYEAHHGFRTERLLLKYHDALKTASNQPSDRSQ